ncbi:MarR family transcriptional regulator [Bradyrhizobium sp. U87765 SZCCT0131]|nr:MarR family transcriptional regulator [Bradyrhizobium sp. U87765 SZCCT0131]MBR1264501.1 MarR family transcriptional regulator [Bradyrhizobium sp. U87765 SZCCT0134]MBR1304592.1 MarR family transcriptional regulator [Bradyrhizobium sp. U87765 SZCCT0110]MBR1322551.1 MarR family transcriptional regulator [Bradyrhizobium sp. U87765 SZCCT0109]MBR1346521.1 MarR family transcriptional regulator [Bradyrhizobium sp. U87765 SZCCT0048]
MPGHLVRRLHQISTGVFSETMARHGEDITPVQYGALCAIREYPELDQVTLAGLIAYDRVTIGGVVDRLESKGLVKRNVNRQDRRSRSLALTVAGAKLLKRLDPIVADLQGDILVGLSEAERVQLIRLMTKTVAGGNDLSRAPLAAGEGG